MTDNATNDTTTGFSKQLAHMKVLLDGLLACDASSAQNGCGARPAAPDAKTGGCCLAQAGECEKMKLITAQVRETTLQAYDAVRKHPYETAAIAVGAGLLVWWMVSHRKSVV